MLKKHNTEREEKVLQTVQQNVSVKNRGYFCVTVLVKPWNRKGPKLERRKLKGIDEHKKNDGQSDKRQKNQCQNALPQGDPFCAKKVKKKRKRFMISLVRIGGIRRLIGFKCGM